MTIAITAATGQLGRLVVDALIERGVPASDVVALGRNPEKLATLEPLGVQTRVADHSDPAALSAALHDVDRVLLISGNVPGARLEHHLNVVAAAKNADVDLIAYTSITNADLSGMKLAAEHVATEEAIVASGLAHSFLRNGWYLENYTDQLSTQLEHGAVLGSAGEGRVSAATRADFAAAAAAVLTSDAPEKVYELGGEAFTLDEYAAAVTEVTGTQVVYRDLPPEAYVEVLVGAGVPAPFADILADSDLGVARDALFVEPDALVTLIGRPATSVTEAVRAAQA